MGKQFTVATGFRDVRYTVANPKSYNAGDTVILKDAEYSTLPASLSRTINLASVTTVADPTYPNYPFNFQVIGGSSSNYVNAYSIVYAATVTPDVGSAGLSIVLNIGALTGGITIANPTGTPTDGQPLRFRMAQDATGSRAVSFGTAYAFGTDVTAALIPSTASSKWEMLFIYSASDAKWRAMTIVRGF